MPQSALPADVATTPGGLPATLRVDAQGTLRTTKGGISSALHLTAAAAIKATPGRIARFTVIAPGTTSGTFTLNDCATTGAASASNQVWTMAYNATANVAGFSIELDWPCAVGIVLSAGAGGGSPICAISYT